MIQYQIAYIRAKFLSIPLARRVFKIKDEVRKVDNVLTAFNAAVADLEQVAVQHTQHAAEHAREIEARLKARLEAVAEAERATNIAAKMKAVFQ